MRLDTTKRERLSERDVLSIRSCGISEGLIPENCMTKDLDMMAFPKGCFLMFNASIQSIKPLVYLMVMFPITADPVPTVRLFTVA
jgi:hypothetical protein